VTELEIQIGMHNYLHNYKGIQHIWPCMSAITGYEADVIAITKAGYAYAYEIKRTLQDFRADKHKVHKHASLSGNGMTKLAGTDGKDRYILSDDNEKRKPRWMCKSCHPDLRPKQFWYVCWSFAPPEDEVPDYAGVMLVDGPTTGKRVHIEITKQAPNLRSQKVDSARITQADRSMAYRYWALLQTR
jgi:hypothetical protein